MFNPEIDRAYQNGAFIENAAQFPPLWAKSATAYRAQMQAGGQLRADLAYGPSPRQCLDLFLPEGQAKGLLVFVHGGYWKAFSKSDWSHFARGANGRGWAVAIPSYTLCPQSTIAGITTEIAHAIAEAARHVGGPIVLCGHSAGGHLVARMLCADVDLPADVSARIIRSVPISGVFDLRPLQDTEMNTDLRLDAAMASAESPALLAKTHPAEVLAWVGAEERPALLDQTLAFAAAWRVPYHIAPGRHHFDVIDALCDPDDPMLARMLAIS